MNNLLNKAVLKMGYKTVVSESQDRIVDLLSSLVKCKIFELGLCKSADILTNEHNLVFKM